MSTRVGEVMQVICINKLTLETGRLASGQGLRQFGIYSSNWSHSSKLETLRREVRGGEWGPRHRAGLVLPEREAPRERGAGLNLTTYKVYKVTARG